MKYLIITIIFSLSVYGSEIDNMEAIVQDIENLRSDYNKCVSDLEASKFKDTQVENSKVQKYEELLESEKVKSTQVEELKIENTQLKEYKKLLESEKLKNQALTLENETLRENESSLKDNISNSKKSNEKYNKLVLSKEKEKSNIKEEFVLKLKNQEKIIESLKNQIKSYQSNNEIKQVIVTKKAVCEDDNPFPTLIMKENIQSKENRIIEIKTFSKAFTYHLNKTSSIYSDMSTNNSVDTWEENTLFTSNIMSQNWVKITGYFVKDIWRKAKKELWIEKENTVKR